MIKINLRQEEDYPSISTATTIFKQYNAIKIMVGTEEVFEKSKSFIQKYIKIKPMKI